MKTAVRSPNDRFAQRRVGECLYRAKHSRIYYALFKRAGKQIKRSLRTADPVLAKQRLTDLRNKVAGLAPAKAGNVPFAEFGKIPCR